MADNLPIKDGAGASKSIATKELSSGLHLTKQLQVDQAGAPVNPATQPTLEAVLAAVAGLAPASGAIAVTPSDATVLANVRSIYVGNGGNVVATIGGTDFTFTNVADGTTLPIRATKIKAATTATNIVALT